MPVSMSSPPQPVAQFPLTVSSACYTEYSTEQDYQKRFHELFHTFATIALQNGVDVKTVLNLLGHFSEGFTLDTYAHVTTSMQQTAAKKQDSFYGIKSRKGQKWVKGEKIKYDHQKDKKKSRLKAFKRLHCCAILMRSLAVLP